MAVAQSEARPAVARDADVAPTRSRSLGSPLQLELLVALASASALVAGLLLAEPVVLLVALVGLVACLVRARLAWDLALPAGVLVLVGVAAVLGTVGAALSASVIPTRSVLAGVTLTFAAAAVVVLRRRSGSTAGGGSAAAAPAAAAATPWQWLAWAPALVAAAIGVSQAVSDRAAVVWGMSSTDVVQHIIGLRSTTQAGMLDYAADGYPRGFHLLLGLLSPGAPSGAGDLVAHEMRLLTACSWLAFALVLLMISAVVRRLATATGIRSATGAGAATALGTLLLVTNPALGAFVIMGAVPSLLALVALWMLPLAHLEGRAAPWSPQRVLLAAAVTALLAHLWQALVLVPVLALLAPGLIAPRAWRQHLGGRWTTPALVGTSLGTLLLAALAAPAMLGVVQAGGTSIAAIPGELPQPPWVLLAVGVLGVTVLPLLGRRWRPLVCLGGSAGALLLLAAVLMRAGGGGFAPTQYYPMKVLWFLALLLLPVAGLLLTAGVVALSCRAGALLGGLGAAARVGRVVTVAVVVALAVSFVLPRLVAPPSLTAGALRPLWSPSAADTAQAQVDLALDHGQRFAPRRAVPVAVGSSAVLDQHGSYVVSKLISLQTGQPQNHGKPLFVCSEVAAVAGAAGAVVITKLEPELLRAIMREDGCGDVPVIQVPGEIADSHVLTTLRRRD